LRKAAEVLAIVDYANPVRRAAYESLKLLKARSIVASRAHERERRALTPAEADRMLRVWPAASREDANPVLAARYQAIISLFLLAGLRRESLANLTWQDIDFENGTLALRHAKGDETDDVAIFGGLDELWAWQACQPAGYRFAFVPLRKGGHFMGDHPMSTTDLWRVVTETALRAGIGHVKPHDLRRTLATELLNTGMPTHEVQHQLMHKHASTTLDNYTGRADARARRNAGRVRYG
jgi:integrase